MTNEAYQKAFQQIKDSLYNNMAIYHERVTVLVTLTRFEINEKGVSFSAKLIKPLNRAHALTKPMYHHLLSKEEFSFYSSYEFVEYNYSDILETKRMFRPYCPFSLWLDAELVQFAAENEDEVTKKISNLILYSEDWRVLKTTH